MSKKSPLPCCALQDKREDCKIDAEASDDDDNRMLEEMEIDIAEEELQTTPRWYFCMYHVIVSMVSLCIHDFFGVYAWPVALGWACYHVYLMFKERTRSVSDAHLDGIVGKIAQRCIYAGANRECFNLFNRYIYYRCLIANALITIVVELKLRRLLLPSFVLYLYHVLTFSISVYGVFASF